MKKAKPPIPLSGAFAVRALMNPTVRSDFPTMAKLFKELNTAGKPSCGSCGGKATQGNQATTARNFLAKLGSEDLTKLKKAMNIADNQKLVLFQRSGARYERKEL